MLGEFLTARRTDSRVRNAGCIFLLQQRGNVTDFHRFVGCWIRPFGEAFVVFGERVGGSNSQNI